MRDASNSAKAVTCDKVVSQFGSIRLNHDVASERSQTSNSAHLKPKPKFLPYVTKKTSSTTKAPLSIKESAVPVQQSGWVTVSKETASNPELLSWVAGSKITASYAETVQTSLSPNDVPILNLPVEIWQNISDYLSSTSISNLMQSLPPLKELLTPQLYHTIDLSIHKLQFTMWEKPSTVAHLANCQYLFVMQVLERPELAHHVRSIDWTLGLYHHHKPSKPCPSYRLHSIPVYKVLAQMTGVQRVNIGSEHKGFLLSPENWKEMAFFPRAKHVKLGGVMERCFVEGILFGRPSIMDLESNDSEGEAAHAVRDEMMPLKTLVMDDLQEKKDFPPTEPSRAGALIGESFRTGIFEPMKDILTEKLYPRYRDLEQLSIRVYNSSERGISDDEMWTGWARFIAEVKPKELIFDFDRTPPGLDAESGKIWYTRSRVATQNNRRFDEILMPVLKLGWEGLKKIEVKGVIESLVVSHVQSDLGHRGIEMVINNKSLFVCPIASWMSKS